MANAVFAGGIASALQNNLLGEERINRMVDALSPDDALKVLMEINFGDGFSVSNPMQFEKLISIEEEKLYSFIKSTSPSEKLKEFLLIKNDYHNAEALIRAKHLKIDDAKMLVNDGLCEKDKLKDLIFADDYKGLPKPLSKALIECDNLFISNKASGVLVSNIFVKAYFEHLYSVSKGDSFLSKLYKNKVDCVNIGVAFRIRNFLKANSFYIDNGTLSLNDFKKLCDESFDELKVCFKFSPFDLNNFYY
jgi:V/A-type H+-transporting ATPase subunit C